MLSIDFNRMLARWAYYAGEELDPIRARFSFDAFFSVNANFRMQLTALRTAADTARSAAWMR